MLKLFVAGYLWISLRYVQMEVPQDHEVEISLLSDLTNRVAAVLDESIRRKLDNLD